MGRYVNLCGPSHLTQHFVAKIRRGDGGARENTTALPKEESLGRGTNCSALTGSLCAPSSSRRAKAADIVDNAEKVRGSDEN